MKLTKSFIAYIDILGFSEFVKENSQEPDKVLKFLDDFINIPNTYKEKIDIYNEYRITAFSDNIVISQKVDSEPNCNKFVDAYRYFVTYINNFQLASIITLNALPIRGAIKYGDLYHDDRRPIIFGSAMIQAYKIENKCAIYPRTVALQEYLKPEDMIKASRNIYEILKKPPINEMQFERIHDVRRDTDGILHCNYLYALCDLKGGFFPNVFNAINTHKTFIVNGLQKTTESGDYSVIQKYAWMKSYHNWFCLAFDELNAYII